MRTVRAGGAQRKGSRYAAATQLLSFSEMTLFGNKGRWSLNEGSTVEQFLGLRGDLAGFALGVYFAELLEAVSDEDCPSAALLRLGLNALYALSRALYPPEHIKAVFELRLLCLAGFMPVLDACGVCGAAQPERPCFSTQGGVLCCGGCRTEETDRRCRSAPRVGGMRMCPWLPKKIFSFT
jgi:DNA repair protein RecO (recombination protein O)